MIAVIAFAVAFVGLLALLAYVHATAYPHIDDVLRELGEDSGMLDPRNLPEKNLANETPPAITGTVGIVIRHKANR